MRAHASLDPVSERSEARLALATDSQCADPSETRSPGDSDTGMTRIESALNALAHSLDIDAAVERARDMPEKAANALASEKSNRLDQEVRDDIHNARQLAQRVERLERSGVTQALQREILFVRDQLSARAERFEQRVVDSLSTCVRGLEGVFSRLEKIERQATAIESDVKSTLEKWSEQLEAEIGSSRETREKVASLTATADQQAGSLKALRGQILSLHQAVTSGMQTLQEGLAGVEQRFEAKLNERVRLSEESQNRKLSSLSDVLGELARKMIAEDRHGRQALSEFQSSLSAANQRLAVCEADARKILEIELQHAEARRDRVKALDETLQKIMQGHTSAKEKEPSLSVVLN